MRAYYLFYNLILISLSLILSPYILVRTLKGDLKFRQRMGLFDASLQERLEGEDYLWVHASSVGEVNSARIVLAELKKHLPGLRYITSVASKSGMSLAEERLSDARVIFYLPYDLPWAVWSLLKLINPRLLVMMDDVEIRPNLLKAIKRRGVSILVVNGRIQKKFKRKFRVMFGLAREMFRHIDHFSMQSAQDARYIQDMGIPTTRVSISGGVKFDSLSLPPSQAKLQELRVEFNVADGAPLWVAGSTHRGEDNYVLEAFGEVIKVHPRTTLIIAPRNLDRVDDLEASAREKGFKTIGRTGLKELGDPSFRYQVMVLDTMGELASLYNIATLAFVGGSLVDKGGHNVLEPANCGKPVVFGFDMRDFELEARMILEHNAGVQVRDPSELLEAVLRILNDPGYARELGENGLRLVQANRGATKAHAELILKFLH